ncbi:MAG: hypothetical protein J0H14_06950 [Alphaproteobacteria bacterium]|nr:hypothetical protein [Alphaproteobacteria bacterium]
MPEPACGPSPAASSRLGGGAAWLERSLTSQQCYASASTPIVKIYKLRDCIVFDYTAYRTDVASRRHVDEYAQLDGFNTPQQLTKYLAGAEEFVQADLAQLNPAAAGPSLQLPGGS